MDLILTLLPVVFVGGLLIAIAKRFWLYFSWRILGFKPRILIEELVQRTIDECAKTAIDSDTVTAEILGIEMTEKRKAQHLAQVQNYSRKVIECYVHNVMTYW